MLRLEQLRGETLERFERLDRRLFLLEHRLTRIEQRTIEIVDRLDAMQQALRGVGTGTGRNPVEPEPSRTP
jgi:hypothetical protein